MFQEGANRTDERLTLQGLELVFSEIRSLRDDIQANQSRLEKLQQDVNQLLQDNEVKGHQKDVSVDRETEIITPNGSSGSSLAGGAMGATSLIMPADE